MSILPYLIGAFVCVVGAGLGAGGFRSRKKSKAAAAWPTAPGKVTSSEVIVHKTSGTNSKGHHTTRISYEPVVKYEYSVDGKTHAGKNVGLAAAMGGKARAEKIVATYRTGSSVQVHYNPEDPKTAALDPSLDGSASQFGIGAALIAVGVVVLCFAKALAGLFAF